MNWGKSNKLRLFWYKTSEVDLESHIWIIILAFRILWILYVGRPSKKPYWEKLWLMLVFSCAASKVRRSLGNAPQTCSDTSEIPEPRRGVSHKRQKTKAYIMLSTVHARQQLARCIIFQRSVRKGYSLGGLDETWSVHDLESCSSF